MTVVRICKITHFKITAMMIMIMTTMALATATLITPIKTALFTLV
jgi:hypothetical protein